MYPLIVHNLARTHTQYSAIMSLVVLLEVAGVIYVVVQTQVSYIIIRYHDNTIIWVRFSIIIHNLLLFLGDNVVQC